MASNRLAAREAAESLLQDRERFALQSAYAAPVSPSEKKLCALWERILGINGLGIDDDFFILGGDSLSAVALFTEVERIFGTKPPLAMLLERPTIRLLAELFVSPESTQTDAKVQSRPGGAAQPPLVAIKASGNRPPLYIVHGNGGNVLMLAGLLPLLPPDQPLYGLTARGLTEGETPHTRLDALVDDYVAAIRRHQPAGPYNVGGFCIGGMIACEMARRLRAAGEDVRPVIMMDPDYNRDLTPWLYWRYPDAPALRLLRMLVGFMWRLRIALLRVLRRAPGAQMPDARDRRHLYAMQDQLAKAFQHYRPQPYEGSVILLGSAPRVQRASRFKTGWRILAPAIQTVVVAPDHLGLFTTHISLLAAAINAVLESRSVEDAVRAASLRSSSS